MSTTPVLHQSSAPEALTEDQWTGLERTARRLARVSWIPAAYKPKTNSPEDIALAEAEIAAAGAALWSIGRDLTPMTLKLVYVVNGTVDFMYDLISAQVHAHGHEIWVVDESPESATVAGQRRGSSRVHTVTYTMEDAVRAGLTERWDKRQGKKVPTETYQKHPRDMLVARAGKRCAKRIAPEAMMTMPPPLNYAYTDAGRIQLVPIVHDDDQGDDDIVDGEIVEPGEDPGVVPEQMSGGGAGVSPVAAAASVPAREGALAPEAPSSGPAATIEPERGRDNGGAQVVGGSTAPAPSGPGPVDWPALARLHGVTVAGLLRKGREFAGARGLPLPGSIEEVTDEQVVADIMAWLGPVPAGGEA